jgi:hypothetical protein
VRGRFRRFWFGFGVGSEIVVSGCLFRFGLVFFATFELLGDSWKKDIIRIRRFLGWSLLRGSFLGAASH